MWSRGSAVVRSSLVIAMLGLAAAVADAQTSEPANKPAVAINRGNITFIEDGETVKILQETVKTSKPTDLLFSVTAESSILTHLTTTGNQTSSADGTLSVYVTVNGQVVHPTGGPGQGHPTNGDTAEVIFANQAYTRTTSFNTLDQDHSIETYLRTKHASGFNWAVLNAGSGTHVIEVWARFNDAESGNGTAEGVVGNRSLVVQAVKCEVDETIAGEGAAPAPIVPIPLN